MKKNIVKYSVIAIVIILAVIGYKIRFDFVNKTVKNAKVKTYAMNDEVKFGNDILINDTMKGYSIKVKSAEVLTYKEYLKKYHAKDEYSYVPQKVYDVEVVLKNTNAKDGTGINLSEFYIQKNARIASFDTNLCESSNPKLKGSFAIALRKNSKMTIHMPFDLVKNNFKVKSWNNLKNMDMNLVVTLYPTKKVVVLKSNRFHK